MKTRLDMANWRPPTENARINDFAIRCFRETGDADYITARLAMRSMLSANFLWSAQHAVEKYLKCILMLNRKNTKDLSHNIGKALLRINTELPFVITLSKPEQKIFDHLDSWGGEQGGRYMIFSFEVFEMELIYLDFLVWKLRQYCVPLDLVHYADTPSEDILLGNVARIEAGFSGPPKAGYIQHAFLEKVLANRSHPARPALIWRNTRYCGKVRSPLIDPNNFQAVNSPLFLSPELADKVAVYMKIPFDVLEGARTLAEQRKGVTV
jgi:hypothetical protein